MTGPFRHLLVFGNIGSGKTSLAYHFTKDEKRLIIIDTVSEERYEKAGVIVYDPDHVGEILENQGTFRIVFRPLQNADIEWIFQLCRAAGDVVVLVEEVSQYMGHHKIAEAFEKVVRFGRHDNVKIVATTQRPADVHKLLLSQSEIYLGKIFETNDARYLKGMGGVTKETIERACALPDPEIKDGKLCIFYITPLDNEVRTVFIGIDRTF